MKIFYHILGVAQNASPKEITTARNKLQLKFHLDKNIDKPDPFYEERSREANEAYENLIDPIKRAKHDKNLAEHNKPIVIVRNKFIEKRGFNWGDFALGAAVTIFFVGLFKGKQK